MSSQKLEIYDDIPELLSVSLGAAETTLLKLTTAYCSFLNGGKLVKPIFIDRIQDSEGNTIFKTEDRFLTAVTDYTLQRIEKAKANLGFKGAE